MRLNKKDVLTNKSFLKFFPCYLVTARDSIEFLMDRENHENKSEMGADSSDKTPNGDSNTAEDSSHATNEDLEGEIGQYKDYWKINRKN